MEKINNEYDFWHNTAIHLLSIPIQELRQDDLNTENKGNLDLSMPNTNDSQTREITPPSELCVYMIKRFHLNSEDQPINLKQGQSSSPTPQDPGTLTSLPIQVSVF